MPARQRLFMDERAQAFVAQAARDLADRRGLGIPELLHRVNEYLHSEAASVFVLDRSANELVLAYADSPDTKKLLGLRVLLGQGVVGWVVKYNEDLIVPSTALDARFFSGIDKQTGFVTRSILCVPVAMAGHVLGAIEALNKTTGHFNDEDVVLLQEIAALIAECLATE